MRRIKTLLIAGAAVFCLASCTKKEDVGAAPHATVFMRDGTQLAGRVTSSSPSSLTLVADDNSTRTLAMRDVKSVEYDDAPPAAPVPAGAPGAPAPADTADAYHDRHQHPIQSAINTQTFNVPAGTRVSVRTEETIDSARAAAGQTYAAEVAKDVLDNEGHVVIPRGANAQIIIRSASKGGHVTGRSDLVMDLASVSVEGRRYRLETVDLREKGREAVGANKRTAEFTGGGAAIGAIIGAIAGHGKGAAIGAASGAGAGALTQIVTKGESIRVPAESILTFQLETSLHVAAN